ncbi:MAG: DUF5134 domain-containing protein [Mycobacterium sp.]|uniref:DUF5134 domain-containing protein n=1 Tax=Mycobacterium sp. TaxID=1785 RepID=UPI001EC9B4BC|nr:DUF5134 domain-containing protein [Mycobacterium sp.]MBV8788282.1 DUF5134 domain-containing protein [Mycobacterium sp.]
MSEDVALRWIVSALLGAGIATYVYVLVRHARWTNTVGHVLHLTMLAAMILMAWHIDLGVPPMGPIIFFLFAGIWFVHVACTASSTAPDRLHNYYSAAMMAAMAWMYAGMNDSLPGQVNHSLDSASRISRPINISGMDMNMTGMEMSRNEMPQTLSAPGWVTSVNWIATLGFAIMALYWPCRYFAERRRSPITYASAPSGLAPVYQACGAAGTALMFGNLL